MPRSVRESARLESLPVTRCGLNSSRLHCSVEGLAGRRGRFVIFDEAGRRRAEAALWRDAKAEGGRGACGEVGPIAGHAGDALQEVGDIRRTGLS